MYQFYMPKKITSDIDSINRLINIYSKIVNNIYDDKILFNFSSTNWMSGEMVSLFGAMTYNLRYKYNKWVFIQEVSSNIEDLFRGNKFSEIIGNMNDGKLKETSIKFECFKKELENGNNNCFTEYLKQELNPKINMSADEIEYITTNLSEIFINSRTHGATFDIFCCGQKYPKINKLRLVIVDLGVGIPFNVKNKIANLSDIECIKWSLKKGNTTKDLSKDSGGLGLNAVLEFIKNHNGDMSIISHYGQYNYKEKIMKESEDCFEGTIVYIDFDYSAIKSVDKLFIKIKKDNNLWNF